MDLASRQNDTADRSPLLRIPSLVASRPLSFFASIHGWASGSRPVLASFVIVGRSPTNS